MLREVVHIDERLCDGCGECVPSCAEGAIVIVGGKARLVDEALCDGLGACLGRCPQGAITVVRRQAVPFDTLSFKRNPEGAEVGETGGRPVPSIAVLGPLPPVAGECPGSRAATFTSLDLGTTGRDGGTPRGSQLRHWPVQLHLVPPTASFYRDADLLLAADCSAFAAGDFHSRFLRGRALAIACPKLDREQGIYIEKLVAMIDAARIRTLTVVVMEVPCCGGLVQLVRRALERSTRSLPVTAVVLSTAGTVLVERTLAE